MSSIGFINEYTSQYNDFLFKTSDDTEFKEYFIIRKYNTYYLSISDKFKIPKTKLINISKLKKIYLEQDDDFSENIFLIAKKGIFKTTIKSVKNNEIGYLTKSSNNYSLYDYKDNYEHILININKYNYKPREIVTYFNKYENLVDYKNKLIKNCIKLENKKPRYDKTKESYILKFINAKISSVKNCILLDSRNNEVIFEFGKISKDVFSINYRSPLSLFQAYGLAISLL